MFLANEEALRLHIRLCRTVGFGKPDRSWVRWKARLYLCLCMVCFVNSNSCVRTIDCELKVALRKV